MQKAASGGLIRRSTDARLAFAGLLVANVALACGPLLVRLASTQAQVGPIGSAFWRLTLAAPVLLVAAHTSGERIRGVPLALPGLAVLGGILFAADLALWHIGILHTRLANATLLGNVTAILFPIYGFLAARTLPTRRQSAALAIAAAGVLLLLGRSYDLSARNLLGDITCVGAGLCYTAYLIVIDRARRRLGPLTTLSAAVLAGTPVLLLLAVVVGDPVRPAVWLPLVLLAAGSQLIGQGMILYAVSRVSPLVVGLMLLVQPVVAAAIGWSIYQEHLTWPDIVGGVAIALAVLMVRDAARDPAAEGDDARG